MSDNLEQAREILARHPVIDGHNDLPWAARQLAAGPQGGTASGEADWEQVDISRSRPELHTDIERLTAGGVGGQFWSVYVPSTLSGGEAVSTTLQQIDAVHRMIDRFGDTFELAVSGDQVRAANEHGRIASLLGMEGGHSIDDSLGVLRMMHRLGVRYMTLTHNHNTSWADSATDRPVHGGLSELGERIVAEMNRIGMLVDLSHVSADTMRAALRVSDAPVIFSHSSARSVVDVERNVPDDVLASLAANGGVCMVAFVPDFVTPEAAEWRQQATAAAAEDGVDTTDLHAFVTYARERAKTLPKPRGTIDDVVAHIEHVRSSAGIDHIGLGGDYDGTDVFPEGLEDVSGYPRLFAALLDRGWTETELAKLARENILRVMPAE